MEYSCFFLSYIDFDHYSAGIQRDLMRSWNALSRKQFGRWVSLINRLKTISFFIDGLMWKTWHILIYVYLNFSDEWANKSIWSYYILPLILLLPFNTIFFFSLCIRNETREATIFFFSSFYQPLYMESYKLYDLLIA